MTPPRTSLGDRREHRRFVVTGELWADCAVADALVVRNLAPGGALVEAPRGALLEDARAAQVTLGERGPELSAVVRHLSAPPAGEGPCLVGLEFVNVSDAARQAIAEWVRAWQNEIV